MRKIFAILFFLAALIACKDDLTRINQRHLIPREKFINILVDIHITDVIISGSDYFRKYDYKDSIEVYSELFKKYDVTKAQFDSTVAMYIRQPDVYLKIYDEVMLKLNYMLDTLNNNKPQFSEPPISIK